MKDGHNEVDTGERTPTPSSEYTPWGEVTLPYNNCYIIIEKDSLFYYKEGKLEEVRTMVREEHSDHAFTFKEDADDHILFSLDFNSFKLSRDNYDGLYEYFILDEIFIKTKNKELK